MGSVRDPGSRATSQVQLVKRMARISTRIIPDNEGVDLFFIHGKGATNAREQVVLQTMEAQDGSGGGTPVGTELKKKILNPFVYDVINGGGQFQRPLLISILTDGEPTWEDKETLENAIFECTDELRKRGYPEYGMPGLRFNFIHIVLLINTSGHFSDQPNWR